MRIVFLLGLLSTAGCAVTVPSGEPFSQALLNSSAQDESVLFVYSMPENRKSMYKYIFIDGEHKSTITTDTFARIALEPGRHRVRILQHGYKNPENWYVTSMKNESVLAQLEATRDVNLEPGSVSFLSLDQKKRQVYRACAESQTATRVCSEEAIGLVIDEAPREVALPVLSSLREACESCE